MRTKQFKSESKKLMDMMINSIYTHKEIFLRELISNASDALDKLYFRSLTDDTVTQKHEDYMIRLVPDKESRTLKIIDNGCGMTAEELENNLGTIAKSGSGAFKAENERTDGVDIIGQFGVGFYSAFMVSDLVTVESRPYGGDTANRWQSAGADGYTVEPCEKEDHGTVVTLHIKPDSDDERYSEFLDTYRLQSLVKKYSDYIRYPIKMQVTVKKAKEGSENEYEDVTEDRTLNSMIPLWKKNKSEIKKEEYDAFYRDRFMDYEEPAAVIHTRTEGQATFSALMFIPSHAPFDYYTKNYEKGLCLYSKGVMITEKCAELLPDYFSFVKGLVDSEDLSLNISREMLQHDNQLRLIARTIEKKIKAELEKMLKDDREKYEEFYKSFGTGLKFGIYNDYGMHKDTLKDLIMFTSSYEGKNVTLREYCDRMKEGQKEIYYACGETVERIETLPQTDMVKDKGYEVLYLTESVDEFAVKILGEYDGKKFVNVCDNELDLSTEEEKEKLARENEESKELFAEMKKAIGDGVTAVRFTDILKKHPVCLTSEGGVSLEMEKVINAMPTENKIKAELVLEINADHPIANKLKELYENDKATLADYSKILYTEACLISGAPVKDPLGYSELVCALMTK